MTRARTLADMISDGVIGTTELADDAITPVKLDETGNYTIAQLGVNGTITADGLTVDGAVNMATTALVTGVLTTTAATVHTNGITMPDSAKAIFGTGSDLEIYHDGNSKIADVGNGKLELHSNGTGVFIQKGATEYMAQFLTDGAVTLYHDNAAKIATTSTGINVTGQATLTSGQLDFSGSISDPNGAAYIWRPADNTLAFGTANEERMRINSSGNVHITDNTNGPDAALHIEKATPQIRLQLNGNSGYNTIESGGANELIFGRSGSEQMRINSTGVPTFIQTRTETNSEADMGAYLHLRNTSANLNTGIGLTLGSNNNGGTAIVAQRVGANNEHTLKFQTRNSAGASLTRMQISGGGIVTKPYQPAFSVRLSAVSSADYTGGPTVIAKAVTTYFANVGNHFSVSTGRFTAPVSGYYVFGACVRYDAFSGNYFYLTMTKNGATISRHLSSSQGAYLPATVQSAVLMIQNDYVDLNVQSSGDTAVGLDGDSNFFGYLVG